MPQNNLNKTIWEQLKDLGLLSEEFFPWWSDIDELHKDRNFKQKDNDIKHANIQSSQLENINTSDKDITKNKIIEVLSRDTITESRQIFSDKHFDLLWDILFDTDRDNIEKYIYILNQKYTKNEIQSYVDIIKDENIKQLFIKLKDPKELNRASDLLDKDKSTSLNLFTILSSKLTDDDLESKNAANFLEKTFQKLRNNLYKHFNNTSRSNLTYWLQFLYLKSFNANSIVIWLPTFLHSEIEIDIVDNNKIDEFHPIVIFIKWIRKNFSNNHIDIEYSNDLDDFIRPNNDKQNSSKQYNAIKTLWNNDISIYQIPSYYDMRNNWLDNKLWSNANKIKFLIMQNIYNKKIFWLKLYKSDYGFIYAYLNHLSKSQGKRSVIINAKSLWKLYGWDFNPSNISKIRKSEILENNIDILVVEDAGYFRDHAPSTGKRLSSLSKSVILIWSQISSFDNPFGDICPTSMIYDLPVSSKKSQKEIFANIYNKQLNSLFAVNLLPNVLDILPMIISSVNRNYWGMKSVFDNLSTIKDNSKNYIWKPTTLSFWENHEIILSPEDIWEIVLFLKIYAHPFELSLDDIDDCMNSFYGKENIAWWWYSAELSSLASNLLTEEYPTDILWIPIKKYKLSDIKKDISSKYKCNPDAKKDIKHIIQDNWLLIELVDILNKKIIQKYYNITWDL